MKILLEGAQGTGKDTLVSALIESGFQIPEIEKLRPHRYSDISEDTDQLILITDYICQLTQYKDGIWNRGFLSGLAVTKWLVEKEIVSKNVLDYYFNFVKTHSDLFKHDFIFILQPWSVDVPSDNRRDVNIKTRDTLQKYILEYAKELDVSYILIPAISVEVRKNLVLQAIEKSK